MNRWQIVAAILGGLAIVAAVLIAQFAINQTICSAFGCQ